MYRSSEGAIFLTDTEGCEFQTTLKRLVGEFSSNEELSESTVSNALQNAIFEALDPQGRRPDDFLIRLDKAIDKLARLASLPIRDYECFIEVAGLAPESLPAKFGIVNFVAFNKYQLQRLQHKALLAGESDPTRRKFLREHAADMLGCCFGIVTVHARDDKAALALAKRSVRGTVDSLNFFADMLPYNHGWVFLPGDREQRGTTAVAIKPDGSCYWSMSRTKPSGHFSMDKLRSTRSARALVKRVSGLLRTSRNKTEELLVTGVQTAGRATIATRPEESFLLFAIALESLILPQKGQELTHRLSQRVARLLAKGVTKRLEHSKQISSLYAIRSKIVHSGSYEVDASDLNLIRVYTKKVIARMLSKAEVRRCRTTPELSEWLKRLELQ